MEMEGTGWGISPSDGCERTLSSNLDVGYGRIVSLSSVKFLYSCRTYTNLLVSLTSPSCGLHQASKKFHTLSDLIPAPGVHIGYDF